MNQAPIITVRTSYTDTVTPDEIIDQLLKDRAVGDSENFLNPPLPSTISLSTFFEKQSDFTKSWKKTLTLLKKLHDAKAPIVVYSDYDADGVTGGAIMWEGLHKLGFNVMPYIPDRKTEGYGFSIKGLDAVIEEFNPELIISVDHGIVGHSQITYALSKNIPVIVTDHHQIQDAPPKDAFAVFHSDKLSGSGVAYFFIQELYKEWDHTMPDDYAAFAAIGTVCDLIPLVGATRSLVKFGLQALSRTARLGLRNMMKEAGIDGKSMDTYHIGFVLGPRINAFGRLEHAIDALRLLCTTSLGKANELAQKASSINKQRQSIVETSVKEALKSVDPSGHLIILKSEDWDEGIIGLIAGKVLQTYYRPTIVLTKSDGHYKASVRSVSGVDIMKFLTKQRKHFTDMGGHKAAAGFTIPAENIDAWMAEALQQAEEDITDKDLIPRLEVDAEVPLSSITFPLAQRLQELEPYGMGNAKPLFSTMATVKDTIALGKTGAHCKLLLQSGDSTLEVLQFNMSKEKCLSKNTKARFVLEVGVNEWNGRQSLQAMVKHMEELPDK